MPVPTINPREVQSLAAGGKTVSLIDVRTPAEFREICVPWAKNIPLDRLDAAALAAEYPAEQPIYFICRTGNRSGQVCEKLARIGRANAINVSGGMVAWDADGLPVARGKKTISLERQVRIAAGLLVLVGVALGWLVHPAGLALSAFVGAGLTFAGVTDTCGMAMLLARMPWNRVKAASPPPQPTAAA